MSTAEKNGIELFSHNAQAYEAAVSMLDETGKAAIIHPTGTGKSFIGFKLAEDNPDKIICWLSPSEYIYKTQLENLSATGADIPVNIVFYTYKKLTLLSEDELKEIDFDILICDEFHRVGAQTWGCGVNALIALYPNAPILGLSATNIRYLDNQRDMADELFDGNIASEMTLGEAIVRGILNAPKYVLSAFSYQNELDKLKTKIFNTQSKLVRDTAERYYEALRRALDKSEGLDEVFNKHMTDRTGKYLVFTSNIEAMQTCIDNVPKWFSKIDKHPHIYSLYAADPTTSKAFVKFKEDTDSTHLRLLFSINALNEGVHVEDISGVILFRPTDSPIIYKQQIGRALSAGKKQATPVILDVVNNFENLYSIGAIEEEMRAAITYYRYFGDGEQIITEQFKIIDEVRDCKQLFDELEGTLTASWELMYRQAKSYYEKNNNLEVPVDYKTVEGYSLGHWLQTQRQVRSGKITGNLDQTRIDLLDEIGMRWISANDLSWERNYVACKQYVEQNGDLNVPGDYITEKGLPLGKWIISVRNYRRTGIKSNYFTPEREKMLDDLGMVWNQPDYLWNRNYSAALDYYMIHGNIDVSTGYIHNGVKLYNWLADLRKMFRNAPGRRGSLTESQIAQMDELGMRWKSQKELVWDKGFAEAKAYYEENGAADAPFAYISSSGFKLGIWLSKCREKYTKNALTKEQIEQLESINIVWNKSRKNDWDECFAHAEAYYIENGNINVPPDYTADGIWLNKWLNEQKQILLGNRKGKTLTDKQKQKLYSISFSTVDPREVKWNQLYSELKNYYIKHGNIRLPLHYRSLSGQDLYAWLSNQKAYYATGKLSDDRILLLESIGVTWSYHSQSEKSTYTA